MYQVWLNSCVGTDISQNRQLYWLAWSKIPSKHNINWMEEWFKEAWGVNYKMQLLLLPRRLLSQAHRMLSAWWSIRVMGYFRNIQKAEADCRCSHIWPDSKKHLHTNTKVLIITVLSVDTKSMTLFAWTKFKI